MTLAYHRKSAAFYLSSFAVTTHSEWSTWGMCEQKPANSLRGTRSRKKICGTSLFRFNETTCAHVSSEGLICESQANDTDCTLHQASIGFPIQISGTNCTLVKDRERDCLVFKSFSKGMLLYLSLRSFGTQNSHNCIV